MPFPEEFLTELKARNDLAELVSKYAPLRRAGSNTVCCCPFHSEKTPSFTIFSAGDHFYCFGCGAGGDVITFLMRMEGLDYLSAVEQLCQRAGMTMPESQGHGPKIDKNRLFGLNAAAARYFYEKLIHPTEGKIARDYLVRRGFDLKNIKRFGLGYAPDSWDGLSDHLIRLGYTTQELKDMFLAGIGKNGRVFDYFKNRLMFPVIDVSGRVIAFSGRYIGPEGGYGSDRKYFNTADTPVFKKSRNLYGLNVAKNAKTNTLILCEGNMDVLALQAAGFENSVAGLGTALTAEQVRLMKRYADTVYLCYDSDEAGRNAAKKAMRLLSEAGVQVKVLSLTGAKDPDEFMKKFGRLRFEELMKNASGQIEYQFHQLAKGHDLNTLDGKKDFIRDVVGVLSVSGTPLEKDLFLQKLSQVTGVSREVLDRELAMRIRSEAKRGNEERIRKDMEKAAGYGAKDPDRLRFAASASKEENVLGILLLRTEYLSDPSVRELLDPQLFASPFHRQLLELLLKLTQDHQSTDIAALGEHLSPDQISLATGYRVKRSQLPDNSPQLLKEMIAALQAAQDTQQNADQPLDQWLESLKKKKKGTPQ